MIVGLTYFKASGKYYTGPIPWELPDHMLHHHIVSKLRGLAGTGQRGDMPGIAGAGWDGYVLLQIGNVPHILELHTREVTSP